MVPTVCRQCGAGLDPHAQFCVFCGAMIDPNLAQARPRAWPVVILAVVGGVLGLVTIIGAVVFFRGDVSLVSAAPTASAGRPTNGPRSPGSTEPARPTPPATAQHPTPRAEPTPVAPTYQRPTTQHPTTQQPTTPPRTQPGSQWPDYVYGGPDDLCRTPTFPEPELIRVGSGYKTATHSAEAALVALGYDGVTVDGFLDSSSAAALTRFQQNNDLIADGTLGQQSWTALRERLLRYDKC